MNSNLQNQQQPKCARGEKNLLGWCFILFLFCFVLFLFCFVLFLFCFILFLFCLLNRLSFSNKINGQWLPWNFLMVARSEFLENCDFELSFVCLSVCVSFYSFAYFLSPHLSYSNILSSDFCFCFFLSLSLLYTCLCASVCCCFLSIFLSECRRNER